jgi:hypothetical protein
MIDYPITVVAASSGSNFGPASAPPCSDAGALGEDASFHFAGDVRVVLAISVCPGPVLLANVAQIDIPRVAVVAPTPQVFYNPVNVMLNFSSELRYSEVAATAKSVADMGSGNGSDLLIPFLLLAVTAVWAAATYWIKARMYNLDRLPQAYFVEEDQDII